VLEAWTAAAPAALVGAPLLGALAALAAPARATAMARLTGWAVLAMTLTALPTAEARTALGGWPAPLGIVLRLDALAWVFLAMTAAIFALAAGPARALLAAPGAAALWLGLLTGMNALFLTRDLFNLFVALEVVGLSAVALTALGGGAAAARAATTYLCVSLIGGLLYLAAVALLYRATGALDMAVVARAGLAPAALAAPLALAGAGLLLKSGAAPLHGWLPPAHGAAQAGVSALLSGVVIKGSLYALLRIGTELAPAALFQTVAPGLMALGLLGAAVGAAGALTADRLKALIAYSTVAQVGYMVLALGVSAHSPRAAQAMLGFVLAHGFAKAALFLAAGDLAKANGHDVVARLADPGPAFGPGKGALAIAAATLVGLPPTGGFAAKWSLAQGAAAEGMGWVAVALVAGGLASAAYLSRLAAAAMRGGLAPADPVAGRHGWAALALALVGLGLGFATPPLAALLGGAA